MLINFLIVLGALILLVLLVAFFAKKEYALQKEVFVHRPQQIVFDYVKMLKHQNEFNAWQKKDPKTTTEIRGEDGTVGAIYAWESAKTGKGEQKILKVQEPQLLAYELRFIKPFEGKAYNNVVFEALTATQTKITSHFSSSMKYPMNILLLFVNIDKMLGADMQKGLNNIKANLEA